MLCLPDMVCLGPHKTYIRNILKGYKMSQKIKACESFRSKHSSKRLIGQRSGDKRPIKITHAFVKVARLDVDRGRVIDEKHDVKAWQ